MRKIFCFVFALLTSFAAEAKSVVFTLTDGTLVYYLLSSTDSPVMHMENGGVVVNTDYYQFSGVANFYISAKDDPNILTGVDELLQSKPAALVGGVLTLKATDGQGVKVYDASGKEVPAEITVQGDGVAVGLQRLGQGVYVVNTGKASFKVMKK